MVIELELDNDTNKFSLYSNMLSILPEYIQFQRDVKLSTLLEGKRVRFDVEEIKSHHNFSGLFKDENTPIWSLSAMRPNYDFKIDSISFIIESDGSTISKLELKIFIMNDNLNHLIQNGLKVRLCTMLASTVDNIFVSNFYLKEA